jgi:two-component system, LytTR family, sensor kinase
MPQWVWIAAIWLGFGVFDGLQTVGAMHSEHMHHDWLKLFAVTALSWLPWALATPFVLRIARRWWPAHVAAAVAVGLGAYAWVAWLDLQFNPYTNSPPFPAFTQIWLDKFYNGLLSTVVLYAAILLIHDAWESRERLARMNEQLTRSQLDALRRQIEPHFLFNTLNAIAGLVREERTDAAVSTIASLSDFLRHTLDDTTRAKVPLSEELQFVQRYLDIQKVRFGDRLRLNVDVPSDLAAILVPNLILQPIVENAVNHGIAQRAAGGAIRIAASCDDGVLAISVGNDGPALPADFHIDRTGVGLANVRTRLQTLYGEAGSLRVFDRADGGVEVVLCVPSS